MAACKHGMNIHHRCKDCELDELTASLVERGVMPPQFTEIFKAFPLRNPDRIVEGPNGEVLAEWHSAGNYFEIEHTPEGELEIMTQFDGETKHWTLAPGHNK